MAQSMSESDLVFNRASVALARSQRIVASWLPKEVPDDVTVEKPEEQLRRDEDEIFTPIPEKLGLGAPLPRKQVDGASRRSNLDSSDKLRRHLLGSGRRKVSDERPAHPRIGYGGDPSGRPAECISDPEFEAEESRSSLGNHKRKRTVERAGSVDKTKSRENDEATDEGRRQKGVGNSYLDELLAKRSRKKKSKKTAL